MWLLALINGSLWLGSEPIIHGSSQMLWLTPPLLLLHISLLLSLDLSDLKSQYVVARYCLSRFLMDAHQKLAHRITISTILKLFLTLFLIITNKLNLFHYKHFFNVYLLHHVCTLEPSETFIRITLKQPKHIILYYFKDEYFT